jgi:hypothetical protein
MTSEGGLAWTHSLKSGSLSPRDACATGKRRRPARQRGEKAEESRMLKTLERMENRSLDAIARMRRKSVEMARARFSLDLGHFSLTCVGKHPVPMIWVFALVSNGFLVFS